MKKLLFLLIPFLSLTSCKEDNIGEPTPLVFTITGYVTDDMGSEQAAAVVSLTNSSIEGEGVTQTTGSNGLFKFTGIKSGAYIMNVSKPGFTGISNKAITINKNQDIGALVIKIASAEVSIEQDTLDFGTNLSSLSLSFQIKSYIDDNWIIMHNCPWILKIEPNSGKFIYNEKEERPQTVTVSVQIEREKLKTGKNENTIQIVTTSNGGDDITVSAYKGEVSPVVETNEVSPSSSTSVILTGTMSDAGEPLCTERGFVFATTPQPTLLTTIRKITAPVNENRIFSATVDGLALNTTYYVRAFAINSKETVYGNEMSFKSGVELATLSTNVATNINVNSAILGGNIITAGNPAYIERGICFGTSPMPTIENNNKVIIAGNSIGNFSQQVSGLSSGVKYYVRAYATSSNSETAYGNEISFTTYTPVIVNTQSVSNYDITTSSAKISGAIINPGVPAYTEKGICYSISNNPTIETANRIPATGIGNGISVNIDNLTANTIYYARAYAINELGTVYGNTVNFKTKLEKAVVSTQPATTISGSQVQLNGTIVETGNPPYIERGFVYGMNSSPTVSDIKKIVSGNGTGSYSAIINYNNTYIYSYHVRAYAINADGSVSYGEDALFFFDVVF